MLTVLITSRKHYGSHYQKSSSCNLIHKAFYLQEKQRSVFMSIYSTYTVFTWENAALISEMHVSITLENPDFPK